MRLAVRILGLLLLGLLAGAPGPATAATISGISIVKNGGNTANLFDDAGCEASVANSTVATSAVTPDSFTARYAAVVGADRGGCTPAGTGGTYTQSYTGNFTITLSVTALATNSWYLTLDVLRIGAQTIVSDGTGNATVVMGALTGSETGAGAITSGSMSLAALTTLSSSSTSNTAFNQAAAAVITGTGTGAAQTVVLNFVFNASTNSIDPSGGTSQGDEAAIRMGIDSALSQYTADDYPGAGLRNLATDGIWVLFQLDEAPEPGTALLMGLGLLGLGLQRRARKG